ncbi:unnamed protein product [Didymodactylos carnosus]|uniref:Pyruvate kinase n=1 Tax=Didymodactylos carnosus TaxID=1234261 RepID=A0A8S2CPZ9_9BILA|nr:unnamed protein product [Didymodactylos carnosus]CAF3491631.1 unnamed protein product [Didymodactylos carnosus]
MEGVLNAGMRVARFNFSHGTAEEHQIRLRILRETADKLLINVATMLDTKGPEIRVGKMSNPDGITVEAGSTVEISCLKQLPGNSRNFSVLDSTGTYNMAKDVKPGHLILVDDGKLMLEAKTISTSTGVIKALAMNTHLLKSNKRINLPNSTYTMPFFSAKDKADIELAVTEKIDFVALSFVNSAKDVKTVRDHLDKLKNKSVRLISKIETGQAISNLPAIIAASDAIMVARGDLGIEIPFEQVPY